MSETEGPPSDQPAQPMVVRHLITSFASRAPALRKLTTEDSQLLARRLLGSAKGASEIEAAMRSHGLVPVVLRAQGYAPFSHIKGVTKPLVIVPFNSTDENGNMVGSVGISEGEPASGVIVFLNNSRVERTQTLDFIGGKLVERDISAKELVARGPRHFVERDFKRGRLQADLAIDTSAAIAGDAFRVLLHDEYATQKYTDMEIRKMVNDAPLVSGIAELQFMRLHGLTMSPDTSCCSCCCCCWGSCSSCSAAASRFLDDPRQIRWIT